MLVQVTELERHTKSVFLMSQEQIDQHWDNIQLLMHECPGFYDFYTPEWLYKAAQNRDIQLWALSDGEIRGIIVTQIMVFPRQKVFEILAAAGIGLLHFFQEMQDVFDYIAKDAGCETIICRTRPGIERLLRKQGRGVKISSVVSRKVGESRRQ